MADTSAATGLTVQQWDAKFYKEFLNSNRFRREIGKSENSIIQIKEDLTKKKGDSVTFALVNRLTGAGVTGSSTLEGNEESLISRSLKVTVDQIRHGVRVPMLEEQFSAIPLRNAARSLLMDWQMENFRDRIIAELGSINGVAYGSASETQKDAWVVDNVDRVQFGKLVSNYNVDHSVALDTIDNTDDKLTTAAISLMKRIALKASPKVRPVRVTDDKRFFVMYAHPLCFRDLKADSTITQAQREALSRGPNNILFTGGDLHWDGVIIKEIEDMPTIAANINVGRAVLCGAQAIAFAVAMRPNTVTEEFDYKDKQGVAVREVLNVEKMIFGSGSGDTDDLKDHGMVTGWFAAVADA